MNPIDRIEQLRADLARVTAERDHHKGVKATTDAAHRELSREHAALRARTAELEKDRDDWKKCADLAERALASEQRRSAELKAALWAMDATKMAMRTPAKLCEHCGGVGVIHDTDVDGNITPDHPRRDI